MREKSFSMLLHARRKATQISSLKFAKEWFLLIANNFDLAYFTLQ